MVPVSPLLELKYVTSPKHGRCTNLSYQKTWRRLLTSLRRFELILTANIPSHFCHETIYRFNLPEDTESDHPKNSDRCKLELLQYSSKFDSTWTLRMEAGLANTCTGGRLTNLPWLLRLNSINWTICWQLTWLIS